jgi:hypothetical protein
MVTCGGQNLACMRLDPIDAKNATAESAKKIACLHLVPFSYPEYGYLPTLSAWSILSPVGPLAQRWGTERGEFSSRYRFT